MPSSSEHREKAERNRAFLTVAENQTVAPEWVAVVAFYEAMHLVERLFARESPPVHHESHSSRLAALARHRAHRVVSGKFRILFDASHIARYGTVKQFTRAFPGDKVKTILVDDCLAAVEKHVASFFPPQTTK